jgi:hypothetical protein
MRGWIRAVAARICGVIGHSFREMDVAIFEIKTNALNRDMTATLKCRVCGNVFVHKDA